MSGHRYEVGMTKMGTSRGANGFRGIGRKI